MPRLIRSRHKFSNSKFSGVKLSPITFASGLIISPALFEKRVPRSGVLPAKSCRLVECDSGRTMIDRPLVFGNDVPSIMIYHEQIESFHAFFASTRVFIQTSQFERSFELIKFPSLSHERVEELLDQLGRRVAERAA